VETRYHHRLRLTIRDGPHDHDSEGAVHGLVVTYNGLSLDMAAKSPLNVPWPQPRAVLKPIHSMLDGRWKLETCFGQARQAILESLEPNQDLS
jgi:hypothetical protein